MRLGVRRGSPIWGLGVVVALLGAGLLAPSLPSSHAVPPVPAGEGALPPAPPARWSAPFSSKSPEAWTNVTTTPYPPGESDAGMTWDPTVPGLVAFGGGAGQSGASPATFSNATWVYQKNGTWKNITPPSSPPARWGLEDELTYDPNFGGDILYGGCDPSGTALNDTWLFRGGNWTDISGSFQGNSYTSNPGALMFAAMAFDPVDNYTVLYGGSPGSPCANQATTNATWTLTVSGGWQNVTSPSSNPPALRGASMAYDPEEHAVILYGGRDASGALSNETWAFLGGNWTQLSPGTTPPAVYLPELTFVSDENYLLEFGGCEAGGCVQGSNQTWMFREGNWTNLSSLPAFGNSTPGAIGSGMMAYDPALNATILHGGDYGTGPTSNTHTYATWEYDWRNVTVNLTANQSSVDLGRPVAFTATTEGGSFNYSYNYSGLPSGCGPGNVSQFNCSFSSSGRLSIRVHVTDSEGAQANSTLPLTVNPAVAVYLSVAPGRTEVGQAVWINATATGGTKVYSYTYGHLPSGCPNGNRSSLECTAVAAGTYNVSVTVRDTDGLRATANATLVAGTALLAAAGWAPPTLDLGMTGNLSGMASGGYPGYTYQWSSLPPGCTPQATADLTCRPSQPGSYAARLNVTDGLGYRASAFAPLAVNAPPSLGLGGIPVFGYVPTDITPVVNLLNGTGPYTETISWGDGVTQPYFTGVAHTYSAPGSYRIEIQAKDRFGYDAYANRTVLVYADLGVSLAANRTRADNLTPVAFTATPTGGDAPYAFRWFGLGAGCSGANLSSVACRFGIPGRYAVTVTVTDLRGTSRSQSLALTIYPAIFEDLVVESHYAECGRADVYNLSASVGGGVAPLATVWNFGDGTPEGQGTVETHAYTAAGTYTVELIVTDSQDHIQARNFSLTAAAIPACPAANPNGSGPPTILGLSTTAFVSLVLAAAALLAVLAYALGRRSRASTTESPGEPEDPPEAPAEPSGTEDPGEEGPGATPPEE